MLKNIIFISFSKTQGGASKAASRFLALLSDSHEFSTSRLTQDNVSIFHKILRRVSRYIKKTEFSNYPSERSLNLFSMPSVRKIGEFSDLCHIHWINNDTLSIFRFSQIPQHSIITLHDEWMYCSSEHTYALDRNNLEFVQGYSLKNRETKGIPWSYLVWRTKINAFRDRSDLTFTVPSKWMLERAKQSQVLRNNKVVLLPNPIDTTIYCPKSPSDKNTFRNKIGVSDDTTLILAGNFLGGRDKLKGSEFILRLLADSDLHLSNIQFVLFGGPETGQKIIGNHNINFFGHVDSDSTLSSLYSSSDIVLFPSLVESFGQIPAEALSCSTPVVCFKTSGLNDLVINNFTGFTAECFSYDDLKNTLLKAIGSTHDKLETLGQNGREHIIKHCSSPVVRRQYVRILQNVTAQKNIK